MGYLLIGFESEAHSLSEKLESLTISSRSDISVSTDRYARQSAASTDASSSFSPLPSPAVDGSDVEEDSVPLFEVQQTPDRGLGLFTTHRIPIGALVLSEPPLISLPKRIEEDPDAIEEAFLKLSKRDKKSYLRLFDAEKSRMSQVVSIYYSNSYSKDGFDTSPRASPVSHMHSAATSNNGSCTGLNSSRINHSCLPNLSFSYVAPSQRHPLGLIQFYAIKNISRGKELLSNYDKPVFETRQKRQPKHMLHYGFRCTCDACEPKSKFWERSDARRSEMTEAIREAKRLEKEYEEPSEKKATATSSRDEAVATATSALTRLAELLVKEGLTYKPLANTFRSLAKWAARDGDKLKEREWREKELEVCLICFGKRSARVQEVQQIVHALQFQSQY